jgi:hypothetical protein
VYTLSPISSSLFTHEEAIGSDRSSRHCRHYLERSVLMQMMLWEFMACDIYLTITMETWKVMISRDCLQNC